MRPHVTAIDPERADDEYVPILEACKRMSLEPAELVELVESGRLLARYVGPRLLVRCEIMAGR